VAESIYRELARYLDDLPGGFPATESGVELRILHRLFTPEEAALALHLSLIAEEPRVIARRAGISRKEAEQRLADMADKGLVFATYPQDGSPQYQATHYAVGIWELQVNNLDGEFVRDMDEYWPTFFNVDTWKSAPQLRTIPVRQSISAEAQVLPYERAEVLVRDQTKISVAPCICRRELEIAGQGCDKPKETCMSFGASADFYQRHGLGRLIGQQEALDILKQADEAGLVLQPSNSREAEFICACCGCCCGVLRNLKRHPQPARLVSTPFEAALNAATCKGCGLCLERCQMEAIHLHEGTAALDLDRCIGCGLCVSTCPTGSLTLARKPASEQARVPKDMTQMWIKLAQERGKLNAVGMVKMLVRSKVDRLLATID
jgi:electron transport complex protein RnfB